MLKRLTIILVLFTIYSCNPKLVQTAKIDGIKVEKINVRQLKKVASKNVVKNNSEDSLTLITIKETKNTIEEIKKETYLYKDNLQSISTFYVNGTLKRRFTTKKMEKITNDFFEEILFNPFLIEFLFINEHNNITDHFDYESDYQFKVIDLLNILSKLPELKGKRIQVGTAYLTKNDRFGDVGLHASTKLLKNYPYWTVVFWNSENSSNYDLWIYDGKTGDLVEKVVVTIKSID